MWFSISNIPFFMTGKSFLYVHRAANIMFAIIKLKDIYIVPHNKVFGCY